MAKEVSQFTGGRSDEALRQPPHNEAAERALLGAILMNNRAYERVSDFLLPEHFAYAVNGTIFATIAKLIDKGQQVSPVTLKTYLESDQYLIDAGGAKYLVKLVSGGITVINAKDYGRLIYEMFLRRELISVGHEMVNNAYDIVPDESAVDQIEASTAALTELTSQQTDQTSVMFEDAVKASMDRWQQHDRGEIAGLSTGLVDLDREMGLLEPGDLFVLAGASSMGKTALAMTIAYNVGREYKRVAEETKAKAKRVIVFSGEMSAQELAGRAMTTHTGVQGPRQRRKALEERDWARLVEFSAEITGLPLVLDDRGAPSLVYVRSRARQEQRKGEIGLIVIDYLQIMSGDPSRRQENRVEELSSLVRGAKALARSINCPVILLSSISRKVDDRDNKRPNMGDLKGSGDIEYAADLVAFCYREEYYLERDEPSSSDAKAYESWSAKMAKAKNIAEVIIGKGRNSGTGTAKLHFDRTRTLYSDLASDSPPLSAYEQGVLI